MYQFERNNPIVITDFKWAGKLGPLEIKSPCNECDVITNMLTSKQGQTPIFQALSSLFLSTLV